jgi:hypothetical protein
MSEENVMVVDMGQEATRANVNHLSSQALLIYMHLLAIQQ